ncbi:hypothetical protein SERLA73DRAFT_24708, partial [Serpula lacrymans var. lacrymans S7.3]
EVWFNRSSNYSLNTQLVVLLYNLCVIDYSLRHTGSVHDLYVFESTQITRDKTMFLEDGEWMWADSAYPVHS